MADCNGFQALDRRLALRLVLDLEAHGASQLLTIEPV